MKIFLKVDLGIQTFLFLMLIAGVLGFILQIEITAGVLLFFIFMGIWQPFSSLIHLVLDFSKERAIYLVSAIAYVCIAPLLSGSNLDWMIPIYFFGAFCFSVCYFQISYAHLKRLENASTSFWDLA